MSWHPLSVVLFPPLGLLQPKRRSEETKHEVGHRSKEHSARCVALTFALLAHTLFRFAADPGLTKVHRDAWVPLLTLNLPNWAEPWTYIFWYVILTAIVIASFPDRPISERETAWQRFDKMLVPEVVALFFFCGADAMLTILADVESCAQGKPTLVRASGVWVHAVLDCVPRLWLLLNFTILISATISGCISPPAGTLRGAVFDFLWPLMVMQLTAMVMQRSVERTSLVQTMLKDDVMLATCCGLSVLFFTHSLAMSMAIVFRTHEQAHEVPTVHQLLTHVITAESNRGAVSMWCFGAAWYCFNHFIDPGMMENLHEELMITVMNVVALAVAGYNLMWGKHGHAHPSLEANLVIFVGSVASLCWWGELHGPHNIEESTPMRTVVISIAAVTHMVMTFFFADVFSQKIDPPAHHCLLLTFWAGTMLFVGAKLEHHSAVEHQQHHKGGGMLEWELLSHLGEFGLCEFGLVSTVAWITHLAANSRRWWLTDHRRLLHPLLEHRSELPEPLLRQGSQGPHKIV
uniref:Uncharacterized protein n=1 Tax=Alexandrium monilatum TaxID=311494 RepID=A0A7S4PXU0_9DINO